MSTRLALVGAYRSVADLGFTGGGASLSYGGDYPVSGAFEMQIVGGRSRGGLGFADVALLGTFIARFGGFRLGLGGGLEILAIDRATSGDLLGGIGIGALGRAGYDFGPRRALFVDADFASLFTFNGVMWGPNLAVGYKF
jgi:hypothetical protein